MNLFIKSAASEAAMSNMQGGLLNGSSARTKGGQGLSYILVFGDIQAALAADSIKRLIIKPLEQKAPSQTRCYIGESG